MKWLAALLVGAGSGLLAAMGLGGGFILLLYFALFGEIDQLEAQGINLLFFLPVIALSVAMHIKNRLIDLKTALICGAAGIPTVFLGYYLAASLDSQLLRKLFALFVIIAGLKDLFGKGQQIKEKE